MGLLFYGLIALAAVCIIVFVALLHAGFFSDLQIRTSPPASLPHRVAYGVHKGPYSKAGEPFSKLGSLVPRLRLFGVYYDNPNMVSADKLRYIIGCCLPDPPNKALEDILRGKGYIVWSFPHCTRAVITEFPWRSPLSLWVAPTRVYPALAKYIMNQNLRSGPIIEVCESDCIRYIAPLENCEDFFVPEISREEEEGESKKEQ